MGGVPIGADRDPARCPILSRISKRYGRSWRGSHFSAETQFSARRAVAGRRRDSRAVDAIDILAAAPLVSATSLAAGLGMAVKNAAALLDGLRAAGTAVEVSHRSKRRLYGLVALAPLRDEVTAPRRGRGRPASVVEELAAFTAPAPRPDRPLTPIERQVFDYGELDRWMDQADQAMRKTRRALEQIGQGTAASPPGTKAATMPAAEGARAVDGETPRKALKPLTARM
jgi:hypothetical protein